MRTSGASSNSASNLGYCIPAVTGTIKGSDDGALAGAAPDGRRDEPVHGLSGVRDGLSPVCALGAARACPGPGGLRGRPGRRSGVGPADLGAGERPNRRCTGQQVLGPAGLRRSADGRDRPRGCAGTAGSLFTYSANPLAMKQAKQFGLKRLALVGMSCQASINGSRPARGVRKNEKRTALTIGLLCSKTLAYEGQEPVLAAHGIAIADVLKVNVKGRYQVWTRDGEYHEIPLKECTSTRGMAASSARTSRRSTPASPPAALDRTTARPLAIVRTLRCEEWVQGVVEAGFVQVKPAESDPDRDEPAETPLGGVAQGGRLRCCPMPSSSRACSRWSRRECRL
jgi:hypothetical protein